MRKVLLFSLLSFFAPIAVLAATAGFVPSTGIWFSQTTFSPKETVRLYTVIFNNEYKELSGSVVFYDNNQQIDAVAVRGLAKEQAEQVRTLWQPTEGQHVISAHFVSAQAIDEQGRTLTISIDGINNQPGLPLSIASGEAVSPVASAGNSFGSTIVNVEKKGGNFVMVAPTVLGEKIVAVANSPSSTSPISSGDDLFAKNRAALETARGVIQTVTTTAATINQAYTATKDAIDQGRNIVSQGQQIYEKGKVMLAKAKPFIDKITPWWNKLTNNNDPKWLLVIFAIMLIVCLSIRHNRRRERYYDR